MANQLRVYWPGDQLCNSCFYTAMRTRGICPNCGHNGVLPGRLNRTDNRPVCLACAGIPGNYENDQLVSRLDQQTPRLRDVGRNSAGHPLLAAPAYAATRDSYEPPSLAFAR
jgi:hypothetical protein